METLINILNGIASGGDRLNQVARSSQLVSIQTPGDRRYHHQIECRHDENMLPAISQGEIRGITGPSGGDPPLVAVACSGASGVPGTLPRGRCRGIVGIDDLFPVPLPVSQIEIPELEHVSRGQLEPGAGTDLTLW